MSNKLFKPNHIKTIKIVGATLLVGGVLAVGALLYAGQQALKPLPPTPIVQEPAFNLDPRVEALGNQLGIPKQELIAAKAQFGDAGALCKSSTARGCYNGQITLKEGLENPRATLAHEYMHYVWDKKVDETTKAQVNQATAAFFDQYRYNVQGRFTVYDRRAESDLPNERQAIFCTEISDSRLQPALLNYCKQYLPNRMALPSYF